MSLPSFLFIKERRCFIRLTYYKKDKLEFFKSSELIRNVLTDKIKELKFKTVLDPCCGDGGLQDFDSGLNYKLIDIEDRGINAEITDFLEKPYNGERFDCVLMNPPFGLLIEFVEKAKLYSDHLFLVAPLKKTVNNYCNYIQWSSFDIAYTKSFNNQIVTSVGLFHIDFSNYKNQTKNDFLGEILPIEKTFAGHFYKATEPPNKFYIVDRLTQGRAIRSKEIIKETDLYKPNDDSGFFAKSTNQYRKKGEHLPRYICTFDTEEEMIAFMNRMNENAEYIRHYMYLHTGQVASLKHKPFL